MIEFKVETKSNKVKPSQAVILVNLGTPKSPTTRDVRLFLKEFLSDPRVVSIPRLIWWPILYGIILPFRSKKVAKLYQKIWWPEGSPLKVITEKQVQKLRVRLAEKKEPVLVEYAMAYGKPNLQQQVSMLTQQGIKKIIVLPLYPQYCSATTGSVYDQLQLVRDSSNQTFPLISVIKSYHDHPDYIGALVESIQEFWQEKGKPEKILFSFHGIPQALVNSGDIYYSQCLETAQLMAEQLKVPATQWEICFQSRLGKAEWVKPYANVMIRELALSGIKHIDVIAPAFASDCLETLEEIAIQHAQLFKQSGGEQLRLIPCLNDSEAHIEMMEKLFKDFCA